MGACRKGIPPEAGILWLFNRVCPHLASACLHRDILCPHRKMYMIIFYQAITQAVIRLLHISFYGGHRSNILLQSSMKGRALVEYVIRLMYLQRGTFPASVAKNRCKCPYFMYRVSREALLTCRRFPSFHAFLSELESRPSLTNPTIRQNEESTEWSYRMHEFA